jgi:hypothetical protein
MRLLHVSLSSSLSSKALACCCKNTTVKASPPSAITSAIARVSNGIVIVMICSRRLQTLHYLRDILN